MQNSAVCEIFLLLLQTKPRRIVIDKRLLENILADQKEDLEVLKTEKLCFRKEQELIDLGSTQAQVVIGVRRSGKSTLCYQALAAAGKSFAYVDFDDERLKDVKADDLNDILEVLYKIYGNFGYLFLDEIQDVEGWHLFVNRMLRKRMHVIITGSNAKLLSSELSTYLSGRNKEIHLYPFSFAEYCEITDVDTTSPTTKDTAFRRRAFDEYLSQGGFPELLAINDKRSYVSGLVNNIIQRDIEQRYKIKYKAAFEQMAHHILNNVPCAVVAKELTSLFRFKSVHTADNYVNYLCQAFLLVRINKYSTKSRLRITGQKVYPIDVALMNQRENAFEGANLGWRLESIVLLQLLRESKFHGNDVYYLEGRSSECNFVVCHETTVLQAIQVSFDISNPKTRRRKLAGLELAKNLTGCTNLLLITDHEYKDVLKDGVTIKIRPFYEWALENQQNLPGNR